MFSYDSVMFLVLTRFHSVGFGRNLVEIDPTSLPHHFKQLGDQDKSQKIPKIRYLLFKNLEKCAFSIFAMFSYSFAMFPYGCVCLGCL